MHVPYRTVGLALLLLPFPLLPSATAGTPVEVEAMARSVQLEGPATVSSPVVVVLQGNRPGIDAMADPLFRLEAKRLRVDTYSFDPALHSALGRITANTQHHSEQYSGATVTGTVNRPNYRWALLAREPGDAHLDASSDCASMDASTTDHVTESSRVRHPNPEQTVTVETRNSVMWLACSPGAALTVSGTFLVMLWEWDAVLQSQGRTYALASGEGPSEAAPGGPLARNLAGHDQQRYLYVEEGNLTIPRWSGDNRAVYLGPEARAEASANLLLQGATGTLAIGDGPAHSMASSMLHLQGALAARIELHGGESPIAVQAAGQVARALINGTPYAFSTEPAPANGLGWPGWTGVALGMAGLMGGGLWLHQRPMRYFLTAGAQADGVNLSLPKTRRERRGAGYGLLADRAARSGRHHLALLYCRLASRLYRDSLDIPLIKAVALNQMHRYQDALEIHRQLHALVPSGPDNAVLACYSARLCVKIGDHEQAIEWLQHAAAEDPDLVRLEATNPVFNVLQGFAWFQEIRQGPRHEWDPSIM